jgi:arylformamidase
MNDRIISEEAGAKPVNVDLRSGRLVDISLELNDKTFKMQVLEGFKFDMQFKLELMKSHDSDKGLGQVVRGVHMRLHAGSHIDAPEHFVKGGKQVHDLPLDLFMGECVVADFSDKLPGKGITVKDLEERVGPKLKPGDRLLLRTDCNDHYLEMELDAWKKTTPWISAEGLTWIIDKGIPLVGVDFFHGAKDPNAGREGALSERLLKANVVVLSYIQNLHRITKDRVTLMCVPLKIIGAEACPVRAMVIE